MILYNNL